MKRLGLMAMLAGLVAAALPSAAAAAVEVSTATLTGGGLAVIAEDGDGASDLRVTYEEDFLGSGDRVEVLDLTGPTAVPPCTLSGQKVTCPGQYKAFIYYGNGGNDKLDMDLVALGIPALHGEAYGDAGDDSLKAPLTSPSGQGTTWIEGGPGNDTIVSGAGASMSKGGDGNDDIRTYEGTDQLFGEGGDDTLRAGGPVKAPDIIDGGPGFDQIPDSETDYNRGMATDVSVTFDGQANDGEPGEGDNVLAIEKLRIRARTVTFVGSEGTDDVLVESVTSSVRGLGGNDRLRGYDGADAIEGGEGDDFLEGGFGPDVLTGGGGTDSFMGDSTERDLLVATGNDQIFARDGIAEQISCGVGSDRAEVDGTDVADSTCEDVVPPHVGPRAFGAKTLVTLQLAGASIPPGGPVRIRITNGNSFPVTGSATGATTKPVASARARRLKLKAKRFSIAANARKTVSLKLPAALKRVLKRKGRIALKLTVKVQDPAGNARTVAKKVALKRKRGS